MTVTGTGVGCVSLRLIGPGTGVNRTIGVALVSATGMAADRESDSHLPPAAACAVAAAVTLSGPGQYARTWVVKLLPSAVTLAG